MFRASFQGSMVAALIVLCGCQSARGVGMSKSAGLGAVLIGVETSPPQDQDYELVLTGFDKVHNKPLGYFPAPEPGLVKVLLTKHPSA